MTKPVLTALILVVLSAGILLLWSFDRPPIDPVNIGIENEQFQSAAEDSIGPSILGERNVVAESLTIRPLSTPTPTDGPSKPAASASRFEQPTRGERSVSAFTGEEQREGFVISGLVQDEEGYPLANIKVLADPIQLSDADKLMEDPTLEVTRSAWTDFKGSFYFGDLADGEYRIRAAPMDGFAPAETKARVGVMSANLVLMQLREIRVYGIVNSAEGTPLDDVRVIAGPPTHVTDTDLKGDYKLVISMMGKNRHQTIRFRRDGYRDQSVRIDPADLDDLLYDFPLDVSMEPLEGLTTVAGSLEDPDGRPLAGKILNLRSSSLQTSYRTQSDVKGHFFMEGVEPGKGYQMSVRPGADYRDYERAQLEIPADGLEFNIILEPLDLGELSGWMTDVDGKPIPGFALTLRSKAAAGQSVQVVGDHQGFFAVEEFPEGSVVLRTNSYPVFETQGIRATYEAEEPVLVVLDMGPHVLQGRVTNVFGDTAVAAPEVSLGWQHGENGVRNYSARKTTADQNGNFAFTGLGSGAHTLRVNAPGFNMAVIEIDVGVDANNIIVELNEET